MSNVIDDDGDGDGDDDYNSDDDDNNNSYCRLFWTIVDDKEMITIGNN